MLRWASVLFCGYNGDGQRAWKQNAAGGRTYFLYDGQTPVCELNGSGGITAVNTFGANGLLSRNNGSSVLYTFDLSGNAVYTLTPSGSCVNIFTYVGYGFGAGRLLAGKSYTVGPYTFGGQWGGYTDAETGLVLMTHRYYDPNAGRFLTRDPIGYDGGINLYGYTGNDPVNRADLRGLAPDELEGGGSLGTGYSSPINPMPVTSGSGGGVGGGGDDVACCSGRGGGGGGGAEGGSDAGGGNDYYGPGDVTNDTVIVRGGASNPPPWNGVFSGSQGGTLEEAGGGVPHGGVWQSTGGAIRSNGGYVDVAPEPAYPGGPINCQHVNVYEGPDGTTTFTGPVNNPVPTSGRVPTRPK